MTIPNREINNRANFTELVDSESFLNNVASCLKEVFGRTPKFFVNNYITNIINFAFCICSCSLPIFYNYKWMIFLCNRKFKRWEFCKGDTGFLERDKNIRMSAHISSFFIGISWNGIVYIPWRCDAARLRLINLFLSGITRSTVSR